MPSVPVGLPMLPPPSSRSSLGALTCADSPPHPTARSCSRSFSAREPSINLGPLSHRRGRADADAALLAACRELDQQFRNVEFKRRDDLNKQAQAQLKEFFRATE